MNIHASVGRFGAAAMVVAVLSAGGIGCRSYPEVTRRQTRVAHMTQDGMRLVFDLEVRNPGQHTCVLTPCRYRLKVAGQPYIQGTRREELTLWPGRRVAWALPVEVDLKQLF